MKKTAIVIILLAIITVVSFSVAYNTFRGEERQLKNYNKEYEYYYNKEIKGHELATIINKVTNNNIINKVKTDENGKYIDNGENSIQMDVYLLDAEEAFSVEKIYSLGTNQFVFNFDSAKFKCTKIEYHEQTKKVKYLYFEQISN